MSSSAGRSRDWSVAEPGPRLGVLSPEHAAELSVLSPEYAAGAGAGLGDAALQELVEVAQRRVLHQDRCRLLADAQHCTELAAPQAGAQRQLLAKLAAEIHTARQITNSGSNMQAIGDFP